MELNKVLIENSLSTVKIFAEFTTIDAIRHHFLKESCWKYYLEGNPAEDLIQIVKYIEFAQKSSNVK